MSGSGGGDVDVDLGRFDAVEAGLVADASSARRVVIKED